MSNEIITSEQYSKAVCLTNRIKANAQAAQESLYEVCKGLKEMRDGKLFKELGYQSFEEYAENEVGMTKRNANRYVAIADMYASGETALSQNLGVTKLALLATLSEDERAEVVEKSDVETISSRELEEKVKALKKEKSEMSFLNVSLKRSNATLQDKNDKQAEEIDKLECKVEELENRPVEVAVEDNSEELEKLKQEYEAKLSELSGKSEAETAKLKAELDSLQKKLEEQPAATADYKSAVKIYMENLIDNGNRLTGFLKLHPEFKDKAHGLVEAILSKVDEI
ncbi:MAG: DUF3102 domain-containing protein [Oscillospiraceae bacterium]|nr:DUF3102 domain-containing protein [Oscillospiraceae bacterium]